jgi:hypothetical protein
VWQWDVVSDQRIGVKSGEHMPPTPEELLILEYDGRDWPLPLRLAERLTSDRRLIDAIRALAMVGSVRKEREEE